jgi:hypothetical protein
MKDDLHRKMKRWRRSVAGAAITALLALSASAYASPVATPSLIKSGDLARDCVAQAMLDGEHVRVIQFIVWCSVQTGEARFSVRRAAAGRSQAGSPILSFTPRPSTTGSGAERRFRCQRQGESLHCSGRKTGPIVVRGTIIVPAGSRCAVSIRIGAAEAGYRRAPLGCPGIRRPSGRFSIGHMRRFRGELGLDEDLERNRAAIDRRIHSLIAAWRRGEPVARVSAMQYGQPFRAADQRRLEFRDELLDRTAKALERWVPGHAADTYAGYAIDDKHGAILYIGFTGDQDLQLAAFKSQIKLFAPDHIQPFPAQPLYSERALYKLSEEVLEADGSPPAQLVNSLTILTLPNKVEVGTEHVAEVRSILAERFGSDAPFLVVFSRPLELLARAH